MRQTLLSFGRVAALLAAGGTGLAGEKTFSSETHKI